LYSNVYRRRVNFSITVSSSRLQQLAMRDVFRGQDQASRADNDSKLLSEFVRAYMRKLIPPKKDVQLSLPMMARKTA
jgi:hypothetical protein